MIGLFSSVLIGGLLVAHHTLKLTPQCFDLRKLVPYLCNPFQTPVESIDLRQNLLQGLPKVSFLTFEVGLNPVIPVYKLQQRKRINRLRLQSVQRVQRDEPRTRSAREPRRYC